MTSATKTGLLAIRGEIESWHFLVWSREGLEENYPYVQIAIESGRGSGHN